ncbi:MAG: hypothetical protein E7044_05935 [Lentisphaerae bacterium]|nr:hypothetical protein [Lentisphaerota bacterium]
MIEDIYEPLSRYRDEFREKFSRLTAEKFEELKQTSGVDVDANIKLVAEIRKLEALKSKIEQHHMLWGILCFLLIALGIAGLVILCIVIFAESHSFSKEWIIASGVAVAVCPLLFFCWSYPAFKAAGEKIEALAREIEEKIRLAWEQMAPLNALFAWHITAELIEKTVPRIQFDRFFTEARLQDLRESFGWSDQFNADKSVIHTHSGVINDNPFVFAELRRQEWTEKTYYGHLEISWTERVRNSEGKYETVRRYQTLTATVTKPVPCYLNDKVLIFGNEAAPDLEFSREPSDLSGEEGGLWNSIKRSHRMGQLKKFARNLDDDSNFTMMSNEEFELLFHAKDRNDEVQFRLLFTPLAQQQMVNLLNDKTVGFGDDFYFIKDKMINLIIASHLNDINFSHAPEQFAGYEFESIKSYFQKYNEEFFKAAYFALAPLLIVPLYQQTRPRAAIYGEKEKCRSAFWEHESLANYYGDSRFEHPECITQNILKTRCTARDSAGNATVEVTAYGFRGENRVEIVPVYGNDGKWHNVPVEWVEYLPVEQTRSMYLKDMPESKESGTSDGKNALWRRSIFSYLD